MVAKQLHDKGEGRSGYLDHTPRVQDGQRGCSECKKKSLISGLYAQSDCAIVSLPVMPRSHDLANQILKMVRDQQDVSNQNKNLFSVIFLALFISYNITIKICHE